MRKKLGELLGVARLVEQVGAEDEIPRCGAQERLGLAPANACQMEKESVTVGVPPQQVDRVVRPVGRQDVGATECSGEGGQPEPAAELENPQAPYLARGEVPREGQSARPELGPVGQELLLVERLLVDQLLGARRAEDLETQAVPELDLLLDEV